MRTTGTRECSSCRYWSEMLAMAQEASVEAMCLVPKDTPGAVYAMKYVFGNDRCAGWAKNSHGPVDNPPDYGEAAREAYAAEAEKKHDNGKPMFSPNGTMLDDKGNRSIFDDIDE